jgi:hypothetical protein
VREKTSAKNVMSGEPGESGSSWVSGYLKEEEIRRGARPQGRLNPDLEERIGPRSKASKPRRSNVAAGMPVSERTTTARGNGLTMSQGGCGPGENP